MCAPWCSPIRMWGRMGCPSSLDSLPGPARPQIPVAACEPPACGAECERHQKDCKITASVTRPQVVAVQGAEEMDDLENSGARVRSSMRVARAVPGKRRRCHSSGVTGGRLSLSASAGRLSAALRNWDRAPPLVRTALPRRQDAFISIVDVAEAAEGIQLKESHGWPHHVVSSAAQVSGFVQGRNTNATISDADR